MTVFKMYLKLLKKNLAMALIGVLAAVIFSVINFTSSNNVGNFSDSKPTVAFQDLDQSLVSEHLISYFEKNAEVTEWPESEDELTDSIFNDALSIAIVIPENFGSDIRAEKMPEIEVKNPGRYNGYLAETLLNRYLLAATSQHFEEDAELLTHIDSFLDNGIDVEMSSSLDISSFDKMASYFNYLNYSIIYAVIFIIGIISVTINREVIAKRMAITPMGLQKIKQKILKYNFFTALTIWGLHIVIGYISMGDTIFTANGLLMMLNSLVFTLFATILGFFLTNFIHSYSAINIVNQIISLGTSFTCGVFLPLKYLPDFVIKFAHVLPTFYYVEINNKLAQMPEFNFENLKSVLPDIAIFMAFIIVLFIANRIITRRKISN